MPGQRFPMRKIRDVLRLSAGGLSKRKIAVSLGIGATAAGDCIRWARQAGLAWPLPDDLGDEALEARLFPYGQKTDPAAVPSRRLTMIVAQEPAQSLAALHRPLAVPIRGARKQQDVALALVVPFGVEMIDIVAQRPPQRALAEQDHLRQALLLDRSDPALCVGIQVRAACRQRELCLLKTPEGRKNIEFSARQSYRHRHAHTSVRPRFPSLLGRIGVKRFQISPSIRC